MVTRFLFFHRNSSFSKFIYRVETTRGSAIRYVNTISKKSRKWYEKDFLFYFIDITDTVAPICLPITQKLQREELVGLQVIVAGWGITELGLQSPVLLSVGLRVIGNADCQKSYHG